MLERNKHRSVRFGFISASDFGVRLERSLSQQLMDTAKLDELYEAWRGSRSHRGMAATHIKKARQLVATEGAPCWSWLVEALNDERRSFVAAFFKSYPVPRRMLRDMVRAGVLEKDPSDNRLFIEPCVASFGA